MSATVEITGLLRLCWPRDGAKHAARASGMSVRTAQDWLFARATPSAATLLRMARRNDALRERLIQEMEAARDADPRQLALPLDGGAVPAPRRAMARARSRVAKEG